MRRHSVLVILASAVLLAGCAASATGSAPGGTPSLESMPGSTLTDEHSGESTFEGPVPTTWDEAQRAAAVEAAVAAMSAFARPQLDEASWRAGLESLLTSQAQIDYRHVDPARVPVNAVTGAGEVVDESSTYVVVVSVPTDIGAYEVTLIRGDGDSPWLASRFTPPEGVS